MVKLRRWMTEILLDVTSSLMEEVATEVIQRARRKGIIEKGIGKGFYKRSLASSCFIFHIKKDFHELNSYLGIEKNAILYIGLILLINLVSFSQIPSLGKKFLFQV